MLDYLPVSGCRAEPLRIVPVSLEQQQYRLLGMEARRQGTSLSALIRRP